MNLFDGRVHAVGFCSLESVQFKQDSPDVRIDMIFNGGEITIDVPRNYVLNEKGEQKFQIEDIVFVDMILGIQSESKTFNGNSYSRIGIKIKQIKEIRKPTAEEMKQL